MRKSPSYLKLRGKSPPFSQISGENTVHDIQMYCLNDVMLRMFNSSVVGHGFNLRIGQTKDYKISIFSFSAKLTAL